MLKRYFEICLWFCLAAIIITLAACGSDKETALPSGERADDLIQYYNMMREVGLAGKVDQFAAMRDSVTNDVVAAYYKWQGWKLDSARVSNWAFNWPEVTDWPVIQDSTYELWRRLVFQKCGIFDKAGTEKCMYPMILFRKNGDQWKVSNATRMAGPRYNSDGSLHTLDQMTFHLMFSLPPSFIDLEPRPATPPDSSKPAGLPYDSIPVPAHLKGKGK